MGQLEDRTDTQLRALLRGRSLSSRGKRPVLLRRLQVAGMTSGPGRGDLEAWDETCPSGDAFSDAPLMKQEWTSDDSAGEEVPLDG
jgi:hypothetical protein